MKSLTYLVIDFGCLLIPFIASFYPKHSFFKEWKYFFPANIAVAIAFLIWDEIFTKMGVWGFNPDYLTGIYIGHLPIEEVLFFICIPYSCTFTYFALKYLVKIRPNRFTNQVMSLVFLAISFYFIAEGRNQLYTFYTGIFTAIFMLWMILTKQQLLYHYLSYATILPFFFISNGILTGSFLEEPIVWYNDAENFGVRMFTIPVEDSIYGFLLIMLNIVLYDVLKSRFLKKNVE